MSETEIGAALAAPEGNAVASIPTQVEVVEPPKKSVEDTMSEVYDKISPPRDAQQRFAPKDKPTETQAVETKEQAPAEETKSEGQAPSEQTSEPATPAITRPNSLPAELRDEFDKAAPKVRDWIANREAESHKRITELGQAAKALEPIRQITQRYQSALKGLEPAQAYEQLAAAADLLERDPVGGLKWLAENYKVDLSTLGSGQTQSTDPNSEVAQLRQTVSQLQRQIADTSNRVASREQQEQATHQQSIEKHVENFAKDKPYWAELENDILGQVAAIQATERDLPYDKILERAYDRASKLNEGVQAKISADKKAEADKKAQAEAAKKAADAKKAASVNVKSGQGTSPRAKGSMEDTLREVADRLMG